MYSRTTEAVGCSDEPGLRQAVARRLGYDPFVAASANTVVAELRGGDGDGLKARVYVVRDGNMAGGARELSSPTRDCTELMAAVALALSIAIDPDALDRVEQASPPAANREIHENQPLDATAVTSEADAKRENEHREGPRADVAIKKVDMKVLPAPVKASRTLEVTLGPLAYVATGPVPAPNFGFGIAAGVVLAKHWVAALEPAFSLKSSASITSNSNVGAHVNSWGGAVHLGYQFKGLYGGALFEAERLTSEGYGIVNPVTNRSWWTGVGLRLGYGVALTRHVSLVPHVDGVAGLRQLRLRVLNEEAHATPPLLGRFGLTLQARF